MQNPDSPDAQHGQYGQHTQHAQDPLNAPDPAVDAGVAAVPDASAVPDAQSNVPNPDQRFVDGAQRVQALRAEIAKAVVGQTDVIDGVMIALLAGGHVLLEGVPGLGKTLLVRALSSAVGGEFGRVQFTPDLMPADVTGYAMIDPATGQMTVRRGPVFCNFLLADEINRAPAKTQSALLEAMAERQVTIEGEPHTLPQPMMVMATQNPVELEGTYPLPEAQLDRFLFKLVMRYPGAEEEFAIARDTLTGRVGNRFKLEDIQKTLQPDDILRLQLLCAEITIDDAVLDYANQLVRATRSSAGLSLGAGPRGLLAVLRGARAAALLEGRGFVIPDDIKRLLPAALRHRVMLSAEMEMEGRNADDVLEGIVQSIPAPRQ